MGTDSEMGAPGELLSIFLISGLLLGSCLSEQACVDDACFDQSIHQLKIERSRTDPESGLKYMERSTDLVATIDMIGVCLPGVKPNVLADTFLSCSNGKVEEVCTMVKRGWLEDKEGKSVVNENALLATFKDLNGGEDAVRECLQIPEVYEYYEYYYDYADYFDDYLEESASGSRQRRAANGKKTKPPKGKEKDKASKKKAGKKRRSKKRSGKGNARNTDKQTKNTKRKEAKTAAKVEKAEMRAEKAEEKAKKAEMRADRAEKKVKKAERKAEKEAEEEIQKKALSKLGLKKMPSKSSMEKLTCVQEKISELLVRCAKNILSKTN